MNERQLFLKVVEVGLCGRATHFVGANLAMDIMAEALFIPEAAFADRGQEDVARMAREYVNWQLNEDLPEPEWRPSQYVSAEW